MEGTGAKGGRGAHGLKIDKKIYIRRKVFIYSWACAISTMLSAWGLRNIKHS